MTSNAQEELSPLEIGLHVLGAVERGAGGRGKKGGLRAYAEGVGMDHSYVSRLRDAARVYRALETGDSSPRFLSKSQHLAAIHAAPRDQWAVLAKRLLADRWTVAETRDRVNAVLGKPDPGEEEAEDAGATENEASAKKIGRRDADDDAETELEEDEEGELVEGEDVTNSPDTQAAASGNKSAEAGGLREEIILGNGLKIGPEPGSVDLVIVLPEDRVLQGPLKTLKDLVPAYMKRTSELLRDGGSFYLWVGTHPTALGFAWRAARAAGLRPRSALVDMNFHAYCEGKAGPKNYEPNYGFVIYGVKGRNNITWNLKTDPNVIECLDHDDGGDRLRSQIYVHERLIAASSRRGDLVCDFADDRGDVCVAARRTGRAFVLIAKNEEVYLGAEKIGVRVKRVTRGGKIVDPPRYYCKTCDKTYEDEYQVPPLRECSHEECNTRFVSHDRACDACYRPFTRKLAQHACEDCQEEVEAVPAAGGETEAIDGEVGGPAMEKGPDATLP
jgi:hypothetical protein